MTETKYEVNEAFPADVELIDTEFDGKTNSADYAKGLNENCYKVLPEFVKANELHKSVVVLDHLGKTELLNQVIEEITNILPMVCPYYIPEETERISLWLWDMIHKGCRDINSLNFINNYISGNTRINPCNYCHRNIDAEYICEKRKRYDEQIACYHRWFK